MLIALLTVLLLGGSSGPDVFDKQHRKLVQEVVVDDEKAASVVAAMKSAQKSFERTAKRSKKLVKEWRKSDVDHDAAHEDLKRLLRTSDALRSDALRVFTDSIFEMRAQVTADEWTSIHRPAVQSE
jgi:hypothetical protein